MFMLSKAFFLLRDSLISLTANFLLTTVGTAFFLR